ncbi:hypothetical protein DESC_90039 [Desulfosarcina cetonica]|nr:hypothetical protein DESC_90039 [Desulfosarcina cetonica]
MHCDRTAAMVRVQREGLDVHVGWIEKQRTRPGIAPFNRPPGSMSGRSGDLERKTDPGRFRRAPPRGFKRELLAQAILFCLEHRYFLYSHPGIVRHPVGRHPRGDPHQGSP